MAIIKAKLGLKKQHPHIGGYKYNKMRVQSGGDNKSSLHTVNIITSISQGKTFKSKIIIICCIVFSIFSIFCFITIIFNKYLYFTNISKYTIKIYYHKIKLYLHYKII